MKPPLKFWVKERRNPQLGTFYYYCGRMSERAARTLEQTTRYGVNKMHSFDTEDEAKQFRAKESQ